VSALVIDASIAVKWVVQEPGTLQALALRQAYQLIAPDLLSAECANILWKKVSRGELTDAEADLAARLLQRADIELASMRTLAAEAMRLAIALDHPAYDCIYLALALERKTRFVTADARLLRKIAGSSPMAGQVVALDEA
jgi:predicted nucleic acid-binding protein